MKLKLSPVQAIALGFALIILLGACLLSLPAANRVSPMPFMDCLFTSTSATCVTGLIVADTYSQFTILGQVIILLLIQTGGLGFMTMAVLFFMALNKRIGLKERSYIAEAVSADQIGGVVRLVKRILIFTGIFEVTGALLLSIRLIPMLGVGRGLWYSLFHSISAFCNAGFDLMGVIEPYCSLTPFVGDALVSFTVMALILIGGIGFLVWDDIGAHGLHFKKYKLHTKIILSATLALLFIPAMLFYITEANGVLSGMSVGERITASMFMSVTPRTAGFNTVDVSALSGGGSALTILLMLIGGGAGSTAGGMKVSTVVVITLAVIGFARGREDVNAFDRRVDPQQVRRAFCASVLYTLILFIGCYIILACQEISMHDAVFEAASALGTVGMTRGVTRELAPIARVVVMLMMYTGRVGSLTLSMAFGEQKTPSTLHNPTERVIIG